MSKTVRLYRVAFMTRKNNVARWMYMDIGAFNMKEAKERVEAQWYDGHTQHMFHTKVTRITSEEVTRTMTTFHQEEWVPATGAYYQKIDPAKREFIEKYWSL